MRRSSHRASQHAHTEQRLQDTQSASEWARWLAQFRPEARQLFELMIEVRVRLAREAYARQQTAQPTPQTAQGGEA